MLPSFSTMARRDEEDVIYKGRKLWVALRNDSVDRKTVVRDLLRNGAPANFRESTHRRTPLHFVVYEIDGDDDLMDMLLENGADANLVDDYGLTPLHLASEKGNLQAVRALIRNPHSPADYSKQSKAEETPMQIAERLGHQHVKTYLLKLEGAESDVSLDGTGVEISVSGSVVRVHADGGNVNLMVGDNNTMKLNR